MKVVLHYITLIHYRKTLFELLFRDEELEFYILCGQSSPLSSIESFILEDAFRDRVFFIQNIGICKRKFLWQRGILRATTRLKPDVIIFLGVSPAILSSLTSFIYLKLFSKAKLLWWGHGTLGRQGRVGRLFRKPFYRLSDGILLYGVAGYNTLRKHIGISGSRLHIIGNCIEKEAYGFLKYDLTAKKPSRENSVKVLFSGRLTEAKNVGLLVEAGAVLKKRGITFSITIIGDGPAKPVLVQKISNLGLEEEVKLLGAKYGEAAHKYFLNADLFVLPKAVGLSIIHGLSFGLPVITSDEMSSHKPEIEALVVGENGGLFKDDDPVSLAETIVFWQGRLLNNRSTVVEKCVESLKNYLPESVHRAFKAAIVNV